MISEHDRNGQRHSILPQHHGVYPEACAGPAAPLLVCEPQLHGSTASLCVISARLGGYGDCGSGCEGGRFSCEFGTEAKAVVIKV
jgi:hypothetical protein